MRFNFIRSVSDGILILNNVDDNREQKKSLGYRPLIEIIKWSVSICKKKEETIRENCQWKCERIRNILEGIFFRSAPKNGLESSMRLNLHIENNKSSNKMLS